MPQVPVYSQQVAPTGLSNNTFAPAVAQDATGQQLQQAGDAMQRLGGVGSSIALDMENKADQLRVDDALNKAKEAALTLTHDKTAGYTNQRGLAALERASGKPMADEYADTLKEQISGLATGLGNDAQKRLFAMRSNDLLTQFHGQAMQHESRQFSEYSMSVREGTISNSMNAIGLNYKDPTAVDDSIRSIQAATYDMARLQGKSAEWAEAQTRKMTSNAHKTAIAAALEDRNVAYADGYLKKYSKQMDADDILTVRGHVTKEMNNQVGMSAAVDAINKAMPSIITTESTRAFNIAVGTESDNRQFASNGQPLTSRKGAIGIAQVMPATGPEAAKLAGLPWDDNRYRNDPEYNKTIGKAYFDKQLQDFGGDTAKAYAAYNAGAGRLQNAIKAAEKANKLAVNDPAAARTWLDFMPEETKKYVTKNMKELEAGMGRSQKPTFLDIDKTLREDPRLANNPQRYAIARADAEKRFEDTQKAIKAADEESTANAMRGVMQNGGRFTDLPASVRNAIPVKEVDNVIAFGQKIAKGDDTTNPRLYDRLTNNPQMLTQMSDNAFFALRPELSDSDFKHFSNVRAKQNGKGDAQGHGEINTSAIKQSLDERLRTLKIDPTPKDDGGDDAARLGGIRKFVNDYFYGAQREAGKKFNDAEVAQHLDALFAKNTTFKGFFSDSSGPMIGMKAGDLDSAIKNAIKASFKRQGIDNPTDAQIMNTYWMSKTAKK